MMFSITGEAGLLVASRRAVSLAAGVGVQAELTADALRADPGA